MATKYVTVQEIEFLLLSWNVFRWRELRVSLIYAPDDATLLQRKVSRSAASQAGGIAYHDFANDDAK